MSEPSKDNNRVQALEHMVNHVWNSEGASKNLKDFAAWILAYGGSEPVPEQWAGKEGWVK
jgi:hypothetical protein